MEIQFSLQPPSAYMNMTLKFIILYVKAMLLQLPPVTLPRLLRLPRVEIYGFHEELGLGKEGQELGENDVWMSC